MTKPPSLRNSRRHPIKSGNAANNSVESRHEVTHIQESSQFSGPMPPPSILEGYERVVPGAAERILAMAESDMRHQQAFDNEILKATTNEGKRGQILGFLIGIATLAASVYAASIGYPVLAGVLGGGTLIGLVTAFIVGRVVKEKESDND